MSENTGWDKRFSAQISSLTCWFSERCVEPNAGRAFIWIPLVIGIGIICHLRLFSDISLTAFIVIGFMAVCFAVVGWHFSRFTRIVGLLILAIIAGYGASFYRTQSLNAPVLSEDVRTALVARIAWIDRSSSHHPRLKLDNIRASTLSPNPPKFIMISLIDDAATNAAELKPGMYIRLGGVSLSPPPSPSEPHAFDYRVYAWFEQIGGVGYTRVAPLVLSTGAPNEPFFIEIARWRKSISAQLQSVLTGNAGAVAAALTVGDRYALSDEITENLRVSGLAHLLSISGLHIGVVTLFIFSLLRWGLCLSPIINRNYSLKKIAAIAAIIAGGIYTVAAVPSLATQRAFVMAVVAFGAVIFDRRAITLRSLAIAAVILLLWQPESLFQVGFQLSFIATAGLIVVYQFYQGKKQTKDRSIIKKVAVFFLGVLLTSFIAGLVTAPVMAYHFNRLPNYSLLANLLAMPVFTSILVPSSFVSGFAALFGLEYWPLQVTQYSIDFILWVADFCAHLPHASLYVPATTPFVFGFIMAGVCLTLLFAGVLRFGGVFVFCIGLVLWYQTPRPDILISSGARLVGVLTPQGRSISSEKRSAFLSERWMESDGRAPDIEKAYALSKPIKGGTLLSEEPSIILLRQKNQLNSLCEQADILIIRPDHKEALSANTCHATIITNESHLTHAIYLNKDNSIKRVEIPLTLPHLSQFYPD
jgi:competence protein ComEC